MKPTKPGWYWLKSDPTSSGEVGWEIVSVDWSVYDERQGKLDVLFVGTDYFQPIEDVGG